MTQDNQDPVLYEKLPEKIAVVTLNRPKALNSTNRAMWNRLTEIWHEVKADRDVSVIVLTGAGDRSFCAGADLKEMSAGSGETTPFDTTPSQLLENWDYDLWKPIICAVNGYALGNGVSMMMSTDIRLASEDAVFGMSQIKWALVSGNGTQILPRFLSYPVAMEMLLTGDNISAQRAYEIGLINRVVPKGQLMDETMALARKVAGYAPLALQGIKEAAVRGMSFNLREAIVWGLRMERLNMFTEDAKEGPKSFAEKRAPQWQGR